MIAILINTSSMGIEHHNQNEKLTEALEVSNVIFTTIFTLEMVMKVRGRHKISSLLFS